MNNDLFFCSRLYFSNFKAERRIFIFDQSESWLASNATVGFKELLQTSFSLQSPWNKSAFGQSFD